MFHLQSVNRRSISLQRNTLGTNKSRRHLDGDSGIASLGPGRWRAVTPKAEQRVPQRFDASHCRGRQSDQAREKRPGISPALGDRAVQEQAGINLVPCSSGAEAFHASRFQLHRQHSPTHPLQCSWPAEYWRVLEAVKRRIARLAVVWLPGTAPSHQKS